MDPVKIIAVYLLLALTAGVPTTHPSANKIESTTMIASKAMIVHASFRGHETRLIFDSRSPQSFLFLTTASTLGIALGQPKEVILRNLGTHRARDLKLLAGEERTFSGFVAMDPSGTPYSAMEGSVDGVLGVDSFWNRVVRVNFATSQIDFDTRYTCDARAREVEQRFIFSPDGGGMLNLALHDGKYPIGAIIDTMQPEYYIVNTTRADSANALRKLGVERTGGHRAEGQLVVGNIELNRGAVIVRAQSPAIPTISIGLQALKGLVLQVDFTKGRMCISRTDA